MLLYFWDSVLATRPHLGEGCSALGISADLASTILAASPTLPDPSAGRGRHGVRGIELEDDEVMRGPSVVVCGRTGLRDGLRGSGIRCGSQGNLTGAGTADAAMGEVHQQGGVPSSSYSSAMQLLGVMRSMHSENGGQVDWKVVRPPAPAGQCLRSAAGSVNGDSYCNGMIRYVHVLPAAVLDNHGLGTGIGPTIAQPVLATRTINLSRCRISNVRRGTEHAMPNLWRARAARSTPGQRCACSQMVRNRA